MKKLQSRILAAVVCGLLPVCLSRTAQAQDLVTDGDFTTFTTGAPAANTVESLGPGYATLSGWSANNTDFNYVCTPTSSGNFDDTIAGYGNVAFANPALDAAENTTAYANAKVIGEPFAGYTGNIVANDGDYAVEPLTQTVTGLIVGKTYDVSFYYAGVQQQGYTTPTSEYWDVSLNGVELANSTSGVSYQSTTLITLQGSANSYASDFSGWEQATFAFTATNSSEILSFLAGGAPNGEPPFSLLADVTMYETPEPSTIFAGVFLLLPVGIHLARRIRSQARKLS